MSRHELDHVLLLCDDPEKATGLVRLFEANEFTVQCHTGMLGNVDLAEYGAVVHMAHSSRALRTILGDELDNIRDEEWVLVEGGDCEEDFHCTVQLTTRASYALRSFVRTLWAQFNIT